MAATIEQANQPHDDGSNLRPGDGEGFHSRRVLDGFISPEELAKELGVSVRTLARWDAERTGPPRAVCGRKPLYRVESVRRWLAMSERDSPTSSSLV